MSRVIWVSLLMSNYLLNLESVIVPSVKRLSPENTQCQDQTDFEIRMSAAAAVMDDPMSSGIVRITSCGTANLWLQIQLPPLCWGTIHKQGNYSAALSLLLSRPVSFSLKAEWPELNESGVFFRPLTATQHHKCSDSRPLLLTPSKSSKQPTRQMSSRLPDCKFPF